VVKAIFDTRAESGYDDDIIRQYHFPNRYLGIAKEAVGDWIIYREPRRAGGRSGYVAAANGGGRAEVQAAHIWPVGEGGPDVVQNGIAPSATAHWLFDRHLISLTDDYGLLVSHNKVPSELRSLFDGQLELIHLPKDPLKRPHIPYVQRHRAAYAG